MNTGDWSLDECLSLIDQVRNHLPKPERDSMIYSRRLKKMDLSTVQVAGKSNEQCREKVAELLKRVRKQRTLSEIFGQLQAEFSGDPRDAFIKYLFKADKPKTPSIRFLKSHMKKLKAKSSSNTELVTMSMKKYHDLPQEKKERYQKEYKEDLAQFRKEMDREVAGFVGADGSSVEALACNMFITKKVDKKMKKFPDADKGALMTKYRERWLSTSEEKRAKYLDEAKALREAEKTALKMKKKQETETNKAPKPSKQSNGASKNPNEPKKATSLGLFIKDYMASGHSYDDAAKAWKILAESERRQWKEKAQIASGKPAVKKKATAWGLFVKKHVSKGNSFNTASAAWHALSDKKKKKYMTKAQKLNAELEAENAQIKLNQSSDGEIVTPEPKKRPATAPVDAKSNNQKRAKLDSDADSDDSLIFTESEDSAGATNASKNILSPKLGASASKQVPTKPVLNKSNKSNGENDASHLQSSGKAKEAIPEDDAVVGVASFFKRPPGSLIGSPRAPSLSSPIRNNSTFVPKNEPSAVGAGHNKPVFNAKDIFSSSSDEESDEDSDEETIDDVDSDDTSDSSSDD